MKHTPVPEDVIYVPSVEEMEALPVAKELQNKGYGGLPIEIGYCNGHNKKLNGLEYHRNSEINVAVTDLVLLIGHQQDIEKDFTYDTSKVEAFLVPAGTGNRSICNNSSLCTMPCKRSRFPVRCCFTKRNKHGADF